MRRFELDCRDAHGCFGSVRRCSAVGRPACADRQQGIRCRTWSHEVGVVRLQGLYVVADPSVVGRAGSNDRTATTLSATSISFRFERLA